MAYLPQNPDDLLFEETVADEMRATLLNHDRIEKFTDGRTTAMLESLGLQEVGDAYPRDLSVGQRQRVALGAITITEPRLLMLDEPTRGLDYAIKQRLMDLWRRWRQSGMGLIIVTHDVELAARCTDRVVVLGQGRVIADGPTREVLGASPLFTPQIGRLFPGSGWLTVEDALDGLGFHATDSTLEGAHLE
jgi:energy-coupling factor transport system ATP-binding protein